MARRMLIIPLVYIGGLIAGCAANETSSDTVTVFAAASLGDVLDDLSAVYENTTSERIELNVAGSSTLRLQLNEGAHADLFAPADQAQIDRLDVLTAEAPTLIATTRVVVTHAVGTEPIDIERFDEPQLLLGACAPQVPCGAYAAEAFDLAKVDPALDTEEADVRALAAKVAAGELDAGVVYATEVLADDRLAAVELIKPVEVYYRIVQLAEASNPAAAKRFTTFLTGPAAAAVFAEYGFETP